MYKEIRFEIDGPCAIITLNRPEQLNAWTLSMGDEIRRAFAAAEQDTNVVGIIFTGAGRAFCSGADLSLLDGVSSTDLNDHAGSAMPGEKTIGTSYRQTYSYIASIRKPVIAAIHGPCIGMGIPIALFCDLRFATPESFFMTAFAQRGLIAEWGSSWLLPRMIGNTHAMDMLLSSRRVYAEEAKDMGMINRICEQSELINEAKRYIADLADSCSPYSMAIIKRQLHQDWMNSLDVAQNNAMDLMLASFAGENLKEGLAAITEKRAAKFPPLKLDDSD